MDRDLGAPDIRTHYIRVTNHGLTPFTDRHDGVPVEIRPGKSDNLQLDMAAHFFGYHLDVTPEQMFRHTCKRQGWNTPRHLEIDKNTGKTVAQSLFDQIEIKPVVYRMVEEKPDLDSPIPADPELPAAAPVATEELPPLPPRRKAG